MLLDTPYSLSLHQNI